MQSVTFLESVQFQSYLHVNDCIFCHSVLPDNYKHKIFVVVVHVIYATVMFKSHRKRYLCQQRLVVSKNCIKIDTKTPEFWIVFLVSQHENIFPLSIGIVALGCFLEDCNTFYSYQTH